jgi:hypothetical protein
MFQFVGRTRPVEKYGNAGSLHDVNPAGSDNESSRYETVKHTMNVSFVSVFATHFGWSAESELPRWPPVSVIRDTVMSVMF